MLSGQRLSSPIRVGLIGFGYSGRTFHAPLIASVPELSLVAVSSSDRAKVLAAWPEVHVFEEPADLIENAGIDLVVIATPNSSHAPMALAALTAGKAAVVDKPLHAQCCLGQRGCACGSSAKASPTGVS